VRAVGNDVGAGIALATEFGAQIPLPGKGSTAQRWDVLAAVAEADLTAARILEPHSDALAILDEAGRAAAEGSWAVFAAERVGLELTASDASGGWTLTGTKPWCSLGTKLDHALITARVGERRGLFAISLRDISISAEATGAWVSRGLSAVTSCSLTFAGTASEPVGEPGWYLRRPGFSWGGIGVAACWYGAARALNTTLTDAGVSGDLGALALGRADLALTSARYALAESADAIDSGRATGTAGQLLALRVRALVATAAEEILQIVGHALGPAPLALNEEHARRVADLTIYLRQHHGERDIAALGSLLPARVAD
jgi:alkylation response protein AidB-like acyl-CoA dehydrogenase